MRRASTRSSRRRAPPPRSTTPKFVEWCERIQSPVLMHRKLWEWCYILEALESRGMIADGARGIGFGVGREPIASYLVSRGCRVTVTDLPAGSSDADHWHGASQWADDLAAACDERLCDPEQFAANAEFRPVDMRVDPRRPGRLRLQLVVVRVRASGHARRRVCSSSSARWTCCDRAASPCTRPSSTCAATSPRSSRARPSCTGAATSSGCGAASPRTVTR